MSTGALAVDVITSEVKNQVFNQSLDEFTIPCQMDLQNHKYDVVDSGVQIANNLINEFITTRASAAVQGQRPMAELQDMFRVMQVLAKSNANL